MKFDQDFDKIIVPEIVRPHCAFVHKDIYADDQMFQGDPHHYYSCGASALNCILHILGGTGVEVPGSILDFGCGAGRVTRWLRAAFPEANIHGCDIRRRDLDFVRSSFRVTTWISQVEVDTLMPPDSYDLIWVGSVFTHLSSDVSTKLFDKLMGWIRPKGVLIFSVHGRFVLHRASLGDNYGLGERWKELMKGYEASGFGYADYPLHDAYGISLSKSAWWINLIESRAGMRLASLAERVWDNHHDVIAVQNANW